MRQDLLELSRNRNFREAIGLIFNAPFRARTRQIDRRILEFAASPIHFSRHLLGTFCTSNGKM
jgi:hypothetical protein